MQINPFELLIGDLVGCTEGYGMKPGVSLSSKGREKILSRGTLMSSYVKCRN